MRMRLSGLGQRMYIRPLPVRLSFQLLFDLREGLPEQAALSNFNARRRATSQTCVTRPQREAGARRSGQSKHRELPLQARRDAHRPHRRDGRPREQSTALSRVRD